MNPTISYKATFNFNGDLGKSSYVIRGARSEIISASMIPIGAIETGGTGFHVDSDSDGSIMNIFNAARANRQISIVFDAKDSLRAQHPDWPRFSDVIQKLSRFRGADAPLYINIGVQKLSSGKRIEAYTLRDSAAKVGYTKASIRPTEAGGPVLGAFFAVELSLASPEIRQGLVEDHFMRMPSF